MQILNGETVLSNFIFLLSASHPNKFQMNVYEGNKNEMEWKLNIPNKTGWFWISEQIAVYTQVPNEMETATIGLHPCYAEFIAPWPSVTPNGEWQRD